MEKKKLGCKIGNSGFEQRACIFCGHKELSSCAAFRKEYGAEIIYSNGSTKEGV